MGLRRTLFAVTYDRLMASTEQAGLGQVRSQLLAAASGAVLEVGAGTGRNLAYYGAAATSLTVTEPDPTMLRRLQRLRPPTTRPPARPHELAERIVGGCDCNRPTLRTLQRAGFAIDDLIDGELPKAPSFVRPMIVGTAARQLQLHSHLTQP